MKPDLNPYQQLLAEGRRSLRPEDIKAYGVQRFLDEQAQRGPFPVPDFTFTKEENQLMDELLAAERRTENFTTLHQPMLTPATVPAASPVLRESYRAEEILAQYGSLDTFMAAVAPKQPLLIPNLHFTAAENQRMDALLAEEDGDSA